MIHRTEQVWIENPPYCLLSSCCCLFTLVVKKQRLLSPASCHRHIHISLVCGQTMQCPPTKPPRKGAFAWQTFASCGLIAHLASFVDPSDVITPRLPLSEGKQEPCTTHLPSSIGWGGRGCVGANTPSPRSTTLGSMHIHQRPPPCRHLFECGVRVTTCTSWWFKTNSCVWVRAVFAALVVLSIGEIHTAGQADQSRHACPSPAPMDPMVGKIDGS